MKPFAAIGAGLVLVLCCVAPSEAAPTQWAANGHYYEVVIAPGEISWDAANAAAIAAGRHLVTITSPAENDFVFGLVDFPQFWHAPTGGNKGPWIGAYQSPPTTVPSANWRWVTDEPWGYANWGSGQPNDSGGNVEDKVYFYTPSPGLVRSPTWNDARGNSPNGNPVAYVTEWVPEPSSFALLGTGAVGLLMFLWRKRGGR